MKKILYNMKFMKKEYIKPGISIERLTNGNSLLIGSNNDSYDQHNSSHIPIYPGDDDTIDEDDVI
jgi:hypothetical protein